MTFDFKCAIYCDILFGRKNPLGPLIIGGFMRFKLIFIALLFLALSNEAFADDFDMRLAAGNKALSSPEGQTYEQSLSPAIQSAMMKCLPPGSQYTGQFALIGKVLRSGKVASVEVRPIDDISQCFAKRIKESTLPVPPLSSEGVKRFQLLLK
jgi:hypothetical protein